jgi:hypothetical protein
VKLPAPAFFVPGPGFPQASIIFVFDLFIWPPTRSILSADYAERLTMQLIPPQTLSLLTDWRALTESYGNPVLLLLGLSFFAFGISRKRTP